MVKDKFPHTLLIPCFGNNDAPYHYQTIKQDQKALIYGDIFNLWFKNHPVNSKIPNIENVRSTLMQGGYFRVDIGESLAVLNLNSLYMACRNNADLENEHLQLEWVESQLSNETFKKFIIHTHIAPGLHYANRQETFWKYDYQHKYLDVFEKYHDKIILMIAGHIHTSDIRLPKSKNHTNLQIPILFAPSPTAMYFNNPGYTMLEFTVNTEDTKLVDITKSECVFRFFQLEDYIIFQKDSYITLDIR